MTSANSVARDSEYASFRYQAWGRWPNAGPTHAFGTAEVYQETVRQMVATGTLLDSGMVYFDARLSEHYPTAAVAKVLLEHVRDSLEQAGDTETVTGLLDREVAGTRSLPAARSRRERCCRALGQADCDRREKTLVRAAQKAGGWLGLPLVSTQ